MATALAICGASRAASTTSRGLGVDAIWLNPCYASPQRDHGYDIADYFAIDPDYGTLADFDALVAAANARGIRVLMDMVANHCSSDHEWFRAALAAAPGSAERGRFHFADGRGARGGAAPDELRVGLRRVRLDAGHRARRGAGPVVPAPLRLHAAGPQLVARRRRRATSTTSCGSGSIAAWRGSGSTSRTAWRSPRSSSTWSRARTPTPRGTSRGFTTSSDAGAPSATQVPGGASLLGGGGVGHRGARLARYLRPDEFHQAFSFDLLVQPWHAESLRGAIERSIALAGPDSSPAWALSNHDVHRLATPLRAGGEPRARRSRPT